MDANTLASGLLWFLAFLFSTTCHEAAHAWVAKRGGDLTAYAGGQVSLNPIPHIDLWLTIILPALLWFGSGGRFTFDFPAFAPTATVTLDLAGRARTHSCTIDRSVLAQFR